MTNANPKDEWVVLMTDAPTPEMLAHLRRSHAEASKWAYSIDEYLTLMFIISVDLERKRNDAQSS